MSTFKPKSREDKVNVDVEDYKNLQRELRSAKREIRTLKNEEKAKEVERKIEENFKRLFG